MYIVTSYSRKCRGYFFETQCNILVNKCLLINRLGVSEFSCHNVTEREYDVYASSFMQKSRNIKNTQCRDVTTPYVPSIKTYAFLSFVLSRGKFRTQENYKGFASGA